ncbi:type II toxin-antitoxin system RelE/ParE family toxin [Candidatus Bipolaricaulota bacterium]|nr:type II toxin-antitoxin system RelE/ParE family toxin [Candidatus Bipolaricaulota bacterium]MCK4599006.1 type II toxin-antitoxin system RelE/ParE family toxin [Candidatus Bipolaricaulota bacterium]
MNVDFLDPAEAEFVDAIAYYNTQSEGLGYDFAAEVKRTIGRIVQYSDAWASLSQRTRRCRTNRFPYGVVYQVRGDTILIVAVMHLHKHPGSWKSRLEPRDI